VIVVLAVADEEELPTVAVIETSPETGGVLKVVLYEPSLPVVADIGIVTPPADTVS
jgi:hypothetical protein